MNTSSDNKWLYTISSKHKLIDFNFKEVWRYRDLLVLFVKRDIVTTYKQTVLGPLWYIIQPLFTSVVFTLIFNNVAQVSTGSTPSFLFNMAGVIIWSYFRACLTASSSAFSTNANIYSKVYFPRVISPLASIISNLFKFLIQVLIFFVFCGIYWYRGFDFQLTIQMLWFPLLVILMGGLGLGFGLIISSVITKYRDMRILLNFGVQLLMYLSAVMYPVSFFTERLPELAWMLEINPLASIIEMSRFSLLGVEGGEVRVEVIFYTTLLTVISILIGIIVFNKSEKNFIDTI